jgi:HEAT repeat protein
MRPLFISCVAVAAMSLATTELRAGDPAKDKEAARITHLIQQLADVKFEARMAAAKELEALGQKALPALRKAAANDNDVEIRERAKRLVRKITQAKAK